MTLSPAEFAIYGGLLIGLAFGGLGQASGFCLMSSLRGWWVEGDSFKIRTFALAVAAALAGSQALSAAGLIDLGSSIYVLPSFSVPLVLAGGALFGYGMVMSNGCGARSLVLLARGNLRSFVVLVTLAIVAQATLTGLLAPMRISAAAATSVAVPSATLPALLAGVGIGAEFARWLAVLALALPLVAFAFSHAGFRTSPVQVLAGLGIGALVPAGWFVTGYLGADDFDPLPVASLTFIAPIADSVQYVMLSTGLALRFGVAVVAGVLLGAFIVAVVMRRVAFEGFSSPASMGRYMTGGALMGFGGAMALGCSIGQGLTGFSTLALASFVAVAGILAGAGLALRGPLALPPPRP